MAAAMIEPTPPLGIVLMGVSGCGKSTTGVALSRALGWPFRDADSFHPPANIEKMRSGKALEDVDRWPWLSAIAQWIDERCAQHSPGIVSCSALKRVYRDHIIGGRTAVRLVYLKGDMALIGAIGVSRSSSRTRAGDRHEKPTPSTRCPWPACRAACTTASHKRSGASVAVSGVGMSSAYSTR